MRRGAAYCSGRDQYCLLSQSYQKTLSVYTFELKFRLTSGGVCSPADIIMKKARQLANFTCQCATFITVTGRGRGRLVREVLNSIIRIITYNDEWFGFHTCPSVMCRTLIFRKRCGAALLCCVSGDTGRKLSRISVMYPTYGILHTPYNGKTG